jgi:hypothetical protein
LFFWLDALLRKYPDSYLAGMRKAAPGKADTPAQLKLGGEFGTSPELYKSGEMSYNCNLNTFSKSKYTAGQKTSAQGGLLR